ncbi:MAG TPA: hypothetical protein P5205_14465 [Candidatus Paceibacterota bacterium]|nr:hypothetical protein [Verrucomicrobiota bacterium]HSA11567.1 hypothetical protein [Candidatus Paceibacterota bacterium]
MKAEQREIAIVGGILFALLLGAWFFTGHKPLEKDQVGAVMVLLALFCVGVFLDR